RKPTPAWSASWTTVPPPESDTIKLCWKPCHRSASLPKLKMWRTSSGQRKTRIILCHKGVAIDGQEEYEGGSLFPSSHCANRAKSLALRQFQTFRARRAERFERGGHDTYGRAKWPCGCRGFY